MLVVVNRNQLAIDLKNKEHINIMRPHTFGNPYRVEDYGRQNAIRLFRRYLWDCWKDGKNPVAYALQELISISRLKDVYLICCCKPADCHGDKIVNFVDYIKGLRNEQR